MCIRDRHFKRAKCDGQIDCIFTVHAGTFAHNALQDGASFVVIGRELIESKRPLDLFKKYGEQHKNKNLWTK